MPTSTYKAATYAAAATWLEETKISYKPNPKSGKSKLRYEEYSKAQQIGEALKLGSLPADLLFDYEKGHLQVHGPFRQEPLDLLGIKNYNELTYTDMVLTRYTYLAKAGIDKNDACIQVLEGAIKEQRALRKRLSKCVLAKQEGIKDIDTIADSIGNAESATMMARRSVANAQAKEILEVVAAEGRKISDFEVLSVLRLWEFRENVTRQNVMKEGQTFVWSDTLGIIIERTGKVMPKEETHRYPEFCQVLTGWIRDHMPECLKGEFTYTSINVNKNYSAKLHRDGNNVGPSVIKAFGDFSGGALNYFPFDDKSLSLDELQGDMGNKSVKLDIKTGLCLFDGKRGHCVDAFEGQERYSLVWFTCPRTHKVIDEHRKVLSAAGFPPLPDEDAPANFARLLGKPAGYEREATVDPNADIFSAPFKYWTHDVPERQTAEKRIQEYWLRRGLKERHCEDEAVSFTWEHTRRKKDLLWIETSCFVLPDKFKRQDLLLEGYKNMVDACDFLNSPEAVIPKAISEAGCCAIYSNRTNVFYALYRAGLKKEAQDLFGVVETPSKPKRSSSSAGASAETPSKQRCIGGAKAKSEPMKKPAALSAK